MTVATYEELGEKLAAEITAAHRLVLDTVRAFANEAGILSARNEVRDALHAIAAAQDEVRVAQAAERDAKAQAADAALDAEWEIGERRIVKEGNKTYWVTDDVELEVVEQDDGTAIQQETGRMLRRQVTADEARDLRAAEVRKHHDVKTAQAALWAAEEATASARDRLTQTERRFSAAKADLTAATTQLQVLALAIPREELLR